MERKDPYKKQNSTLSAFTSYYSRENQLSKVKKVLKYVATDMQRLH